MLRARRGRDRDGLGSERRQLADADRRGRLADAVPDPETVAIAVRFAARHRERVVLLERKIAVQRDELQLAERELEELAAHAARLGRRDVADELRSAARTGEHPAAEPRSGFEDDLKRMQAERRLMDEAVERQLAYLKRKMGKDSDLNGDHVLRAPARSRHAVLHRALGALQLLRYAGAPHSFHDRAARGRRPGFDTAKAGIIYGTYVGLVYFTALPGGWLADRFLGQRRATLYGGVLIMLGHICLALPAIATFYAGLVLIIIGTGLLKPNISVMVGQLYGEDDHRRDAGFSIFYMGINLGAFFAPLVCGWLAQSEQFRGVLARAGIAPESAWHWGFAMAAIGMFFGLLQYLAGWKYLGDAGMYPAGRATRRPERQPAHPHPVGLGIAASWRCSPGWCWPARCRITPEGVGNGVGIALLAVTVLFFGRLFRSGDGRRRSGSG